jgi:hypothetical protein
MPGRLAVAPFLAGLLLLAHVDTAAAHPGVGIVMDSEGSVFYTDLAQVWKIDVHGNRSIAVPRVHTHELFVDRRDNLFGEHLWYEGGDRNGRWLHRVWRRAPDGLVTDVIPARAGLLDDYSFVRDAHDSMYLVDREHGNVFRKRGPDGAVREIGRCGDCRDVRWMTVTPGGVLYFVDWHDLRQVLAGGDTRVVARDLASRTLTRVTQWGRHAIMGLWTDAQQRIYLAVASEGVVRRVSPDGRVETLVESSAGWFPTGGLLAAGGDLWILEYSVTGSVRVRRRGADGSVRVFE